jgi:hypothetical protein
MCTEKLFHLYKKSDFIIKVFCLYESKKIEIFFSNHNFPEGICYIVVTCQIKIA